MLFISIRCNMVIQTGPKRAFGYGSLTRLMATDKQLMLFVDQKLHENLILLTILFIFFICIKHREIVYHYFS